MQKSITHAAPPPQKNEILNEIFPSSATGPKRRDEEGKKKIIGGFSCDLCRDLRQQVYERASQQHWLRMNKLRNSAKKINKKKWMKEAYLGHSRLVHADIWMSREGWGGSFREFWEKLRVTYSLAVYSYVPHTHFRQNLVPDLRLVIGREKRPSKIVELFIKSFSMILWRMKG